MRKTQIRRWLAGATVLVASLVVAATGAQYAAGESASVTTTADETSAQESEADIRAKLPESYPWDMVVDDAREQVFINGHSRLIITDFRGDVIRTITGDFRGEMVLAENGAAVYLIQWSPYRSLARVDAATHTLTRTTLPDDVCPIGLTSAGGMVWFSYDPCSAGSSYLGSFDPSTGQLRTGLVKTSSLGWRLRALPGRPDRLALVSLNQFLAVYDISTDTPTLVAENADHLSEHQCLDAALAAGGDLLVTACQSRTPENEVFNTGDLSAAPAIPSDTGGNAVAVTPDGRHVAAGFAASVGPQIYVTDIKDGTPGIFGRSYSFVDDSYLSARGLAFSATGVLFAVESATDGEYLNVFNEATKHITTVTLSAPKAVEYREPVDATGKLSYPPGVPTSATLAAKDRLGTRDLGTISIEPDGAFDFRDVPRATGSTTYTVAFPGDGEHPPASAQATTIMRPLPYDVNADGYAETIVGAPGEDIGSITNAGAFHLLYGGSAGARTSGSLLIHQNTSGVPGGAEPGDRFGYANASGDFNGDGFADVAISAPYESVGSRSDNGAIWMFFGSPKGLRTDNARILTPFSHTGGTHSRFGFSIAAGDFNGNGRDDLAIGTPGKDSGYAVIWHSIPFDAGTRMDTVSQSGLLPGTPYDGERFGSSVATGDINDDGYDDLAVGAPLDRDDLGFATGSVSVFYGGKDYLVYGRAEIWSKETAGVPGEAGTDSDSEWSDQFGRQVALADYNRDGKADLAVGAPGAPVSVDGVRKRDAGTVTVLYSDGSTISAAGAEEVTQQTAGFAGESGHMDRLGSTLAAGDANGDGVAELAIYSPGDTYVTVVPGSSAGLAYGSAKGWTQNSAAIPGSTEAGDDWGNSLRFADVKGTGYAALIVGADGENSGQGACTVIYSTSAGLTGTGAAYLSQNTTGIPGTAEGGDGFGTFR